ncbi:MAG: right-handed parallel beta-helix repeat-containing protein [Candidatus Thorarchaeota archaeon]|jgi:parallel beta-helix repeat protein
MHIEDTTQASLSQEEQELIIITSDDDLVTQGWPGTGTTEDPFVIEGLYFDSGYETYINVSNVDSVILIQNCWFNYSYIAVSLFDVEECTVANCTFIGGAWAVRVLNSTRCTLINNSFVENLFPAESENTSQLIAVGNSFDSCNILYQSHCRDVVFEDNDFIRWFDFHVLECENYTFIENRIWGPTKNELYISYSYAFPLYVGAQRVNISNNSFFNSTSSLPIGNFLTQAGPATSVTVSNNSFADGGLSFPAWLSAAIVDSGDFSGNTVQGQPVLILRGNQSAVVECSEYPQVVAFGCENTFFTGGFFRQVGTGLALFGCNNASIDGVSAVKCRTGVVIGNCTDTTVDGVTTDTCYRGITLGFSTRAMVSDCNLSNGSVGIYMLDVFNITVTRCNLHENYKGVELWGSRNCLFYANVLDNMRNVDYAFSSTPFDRWDDGSGTGNVWNDYFGFGPYILDTQRGRTLADHFPEVQVPWIQTPSFMVLTGTVTLLLVVSAVLVISFVMSRQRGGWFAGAVRIRYNWLLPVSFACVLLVPYVLTIGYSDYGEFHWTLGGMTYNIWSDLGWVYSTPSLLSLPPLSYGIISLLTLFVFIPLTFGLTWRPWQLRKSSDTSGAVTNTLLWLALTLIVFALMVYQLPYQFFWGSVEVRIPLPLTPALIFFTLRLAKPAASDETETEHITESHIEHSGRMEALEGTCKNCGEDYRFPVLGADGKHRCPKCANPIRQSVH